MQAIRWGCIQRPAAPDDQTSSAAEIDIDQRWAGSELPEQENIMADVGARQ